MKRPMGLFYDALRDRLYVVDSGNSRLLSYDGRFEPLKTFDAGGALGLPVYMVRDDRDRILVVDRSHNVLKVIDLKLRKIEDVKLKWKGSELLIDKILWVRRNLYVLDRKTGCIFVCDEKGKCSERLCPECEDFKGFFDFKVRNGIVWALETLRGRIFFSSLTGLGWRIVSLRGRLVEPVSFDVDENGDIYILDRYLKRIFVFSNDGLLKYSFSREGFREGELYYPWYIEFVKGDLLVVDEGNGRVDVWVR